METLVKEANEAVTNASEKSQLFSSFLAEVKSAWEKHQNEELQRKQKLKNDDELEAGVSRQTHNDLRLLRHHLERP